jgi:outer membrane biosynthesis protein TonB
LSAAFYHSPELPWSPSLAEERRFRIITTAVLLGYIAISVLVATTKLPAIDRSATENLPPRLAKLVIQERPKPPPPPPPEEKKPEPEAEKKPAEAKPEPKKEPSPPDMQAARNKAARSGLLALSNELANLRQHDLGKLTQEGPLASADNQSAVVRRSIITSQATKGSGGISTSQLSLDPGQTRLAGRATTTVESQVLNAEQLGTAAQGGHKAGRSTEQIQLVLDRSKGALYALYHRALRVNPALQGKVVLEITIAPSGQVTECKVVSAELADADLIEKLVARIHLLDFGAKDVEPTVFTWPIDFLPSE